ncbi:MAG: 4-(cytidine 5'-diphospho)-2-C-methyl-D-erythritol kinase, partial [Clostridia bacterium]|nr:4-(cytidine 5'-diphospho)-2-C-methyl-D-erythritol kinase [Clostridia bacterium]
MDKLTVKAYAKVNLYLEVTGRRENGYHDLVTVMQSITLHDTLTVMRVAGEGILLDTGGALPADDSNLVCRAARAYFAKSGKPFGVAVKLDKRIPMQAGMGGGSADAAAMLRALNTLDGDRFTDAALCEIAAG